MTRKKPAPQKPDFEKAIKALADRVSAIEASMNATQPVRTWLQWLTGEGK